MNRCLLFIFFFGVGVFSQDPKIDAFLKEVDSVFSGLEFGLNQAAWEYQTNLTKENEEKATQKELEWNKLMLDFIKNATGMDTSKASPEQNRQLLLLRLNGGVPFNPVAQKNLSQLSSKMQEIYSTGKVNGKPLDPDLEEVMAKSRDWDELLAVWKGWRDAVGPQIRESYPAYVELLNQGARDSEFPDTGDLWRAGYDMAPADFEKLVAGAWEQILPLYEQLHCYVRGRLMEKYGAEKFPADGYIPAHLLGNMWAQHWANIFDIVAPYPEVPGIDVTPELVAQGFDAVKIHQLSENFYKSLGYDPLPDTFWSKSMLTRPADREVVCHASAWDFGNNDLRIKMCTKVNQEDMLVVHHEQGHLYYDHSYRNQRWLYRGGANDGFHEAIGDTIQLSTLVPWHLHEVGLLKEVNTSTEQLINYQMGVALDKVAFLPFGFLIDQWRWMVFRGDVTPENYNAKWWELRQKYQGLSPPVARSENDFDPGAKFHVAANVPYMRYFLAHVYQFQFHRGLCKAAGMSPLHNCSIYNQKKAGDQFLSMLKLGKSEPWQEALKAATGESTLEPGAILAYFDPLRDWLKNYNGYNHYKCGWGPQPPSPAPVPAPVPAAQPLSPPVPSAPSAPPTPSAPDAPSVPSAPAPKPDDPFEDCMKSWDCGSDNHDCSAIKRTFAETYCKMEGIMAMWIWYLVLSAAGLIILLLLICMCWCCCCRRKKQEDPEDINRLLDEGAYK